MQLYTQKFIENANAVLRQHNGTAVEEFEVKFPLGKILVRHLNDWIKFAASSRAKNLVLDLYYKYCNYRVIDLRILQVSANDFEHLLSNCFNLGRLSIALSDLHGELTVPRPLSRLQYLHVSHCCINNIAFDAKNLKTFVYEGKLTFIALSETLQLTDADIFLDLLTLEHALAVLPRAFPSVENLKLSAYMSDKGLQLSQGPGKFSHLKHLMLKLKVYDENVDSLFCLAYFLRAAPFLETLDMRLVTDAFPCDEDLPIRILPPCVHDRLKRACIKGFIASRGQIELAADIMENSPRLKVLVLDLRPKKLQKWLYYG